MSPAKPEQALWVDRGWYLVVEYGALAAKSRFPALLAKLKGCGQFRELLEDGGNITYRHVFREPELREAWRLLTALEAWKKKIALFINGDAVPWREAAQLVWCAGYLAPEQPCRGDFQQRRYDLGCEAKLSFAPFGFTERSPERRHILTFSALDASGRVAFAIEDVLAFIRSGLRGRLCPLSPARDREAWERALVPIQGAALEWPVALHLARELRTQLGAASLEGTHAFTRDPGVPHLAGPRTLELGLADGAPAVFLAEDLSRPIGARLDIPKRLEQALREGHRLRAVRQGERYASGARRREVEDTFNLEPAFTLQADGTAEADPGRFIGYEQELIPSATPGYKSWASAALEALLLATPRAEV